MRHGSWWELLWPVLKSLSSFAHHPSGVHRSYSLRRATVVPVLAILPSTLLFIAAHSPASLTLPLGSLDAPSRLLDHHFHLPFTSTYAPSNPTPPPCVLDAPSRLLGYHSSRDAYNELGAGLAERKAKLRPGGMVGAAQSCCTQTQIALVASALPVHVAWPPLSSWRAGHRGCRDHGCRNGTVR